MFCNNCGSKLDGSTQFCTTCGKPVEAAPEALSKQPASFFTPALDLADTTLRPRPSISAAPATEAVPPAPAYTPAQPEVAAPAYSYEKPAEAVPVMPAAPAAPPVPAAAPAYPSEAPTMAEVPVREVPEAIKRPPVMAPAPKKAKKSGSLVILIVAVLLIAGLIGVVVWGFVDGWLPEMFSGESTSSSRDKDDKEEDDGPAHPDWETYRLDGLTIYLPDDFELEDDYDEELYFESRDYEVMARKFDLEDMYEDQPKTAKAFREAYFADSDADEETEFKEGAANGVPYMLITSSDEAFYVYAFYVDGRYGWIVAIYGEDVDDTEDMIEYVTSSVIEDTPKADDDEPAEGEMWD